MNEIKVTVENEVKELIIRKGEALTPKEPRRVSIVGTIDAPRLFLEKRKIDPLTAHLLVDRENTSLVLMIDETNPYFTKIAGTIQISEEFSEWGINTGKEWTTFELADFIKLRRTCFSDQVEAARLVADLRAFKARVNKELEDVDDKRGNRDFVRRQKVDSNLPNQFTLSIRIFKDIGTVKFPVEVAVNADTFACQLVSPVASDIQRELIESLINHEINEIKNLYPELVIIHV